MTEPPATSAVESDATLVLLMPVGHDWYALDVATVREVVAAPVVTPLPSVSPAVLGVINLRGEIVPYLDTAALLGVGTLTSPLFAVVVESSRGLAALGMSGAPETAPAPEPQDDAEMLYIGGRLATAVDLDAALDPTRLAGRR